METAERIYQELRHEQAAIWYISDEYGSKIMVKTTSPSIKALIKGCKIEFLFGRDENQTPNIFHVGLRIYDDPVHYLVLSCAQRFLDEHLSIAKIMNLDKVYIHFHNELNVCQATATLALTEKAKHDVLALLGNAKQLHKGDFTEKLHNSLDCFQYSLGLDRSYTDPNQIQTLAIVGTLSDWIIMENTFLAEHEKADTYIADDDEGGILEKEILVTLGSIFGEDIHRGPRIPHKANTRELIDVLAYSQYGIFLIEAKALGVNNLEKERTMERKVAGLQNQIAKATKQLIGTTKKIIENVPIYDTKGNEIIFDRQLLPHGIILVSELLPFGEWEKTILTLLNAMIEVKIWIHVMDMKEFMRYIGYARDSKDRFDALLTHRIENFVRNPSIFTQTEFVEAGKTDN
ncbi:hypothetical protein ACUN24_09450 [Pedobacter sp. WC2501]|uniref:hypothetical protein n=1 Tax=Pedobacter sp. WC2501 TaxID=3461400 RepID=UPI0040454453